MYIYNTSELDQFKYYLRNLGSADVLPRIEELLHKSHKKINADFLNYLEER